MPGKNVRVIAGCPLIAHSIRQARETGLFAMLAVSSDSPQILDIAKLEGADFVVERPPELATDHAKKVPAIQHCVREVEKWSTAEFEVIVDLDSTSPLRSVEDIIGAVSLLETQGVSNVITGARARRSPYFNLVERTEDGCVVLAKSLDRDIGRRQDAPICFDMNASIYAWQRDALLNDGRVFNPDTLLFEMPEERSIDIDSELDFKIVEMLLSERLAV